MKLSCRILTLNSYIYKAFLKNKNRSSKILSASFSTKFLKKKLLYSVTWPLTIYVWLPLIHEILSNIQCHKGMPLESLAISVIPGFQIVYHALFSDLTFFFFMSFYSFCTDFLNHWWLLKVKKNKQVSPSSLNNFYCFFIF